jgi:predicted ester cyclase
LVAGDTLIAEGVLTGTQTGPFRTPQGEIPPSGNTVNLRFASIKRVVDGKIVSEHLYFDQMEFMARLGALPS